MHITIKTLGFLAISSFVMSCGPSKKELSQYPQPTDTIVKMDAEDVPKKAARSAWIDLMHTGGEEGLDWNAIEYQNSKKGAEYKAELRKINANNEREGEWLADGLLKGTWREKGSIDQAGSILVTKYDEESDKIYCISAGGTLWKGGREGFSWEVLNQDYRFSNNLLEVYTNDDGSKRVIAAINGIPHISYNDGATWEMSDFSGGTAGGWSIFDNIKMADGSIFTLFRAGQNSNLRMYYSKDEGESWIRGATFFSSDTRNYSMNKPANSDDLYVIEQLSETSSMLHLWNKETESFEPFRQSMDIGFGENRQAILRGAYHQDSLKLYSVNGDNDFMMSVDTGGTWTRLSTLQSNMWRVGFELLPSDPETMIYGEVNIYNTKSGGKQWFKISDWWEYYNDVFGKIHADIMDIEEYVDPEGNPFTLISNHGGISETRDGGTTMKNIGLVGLNVSQYYDVRTHPVDRKFVYAGAQDQGFQRGQFVSNGPESFEQVISGDYGHIEFTNNGEHLWTVYPGGSVSYYDDPKNGGPVAWYELVSETESVWIPPIVAHPDQTQNAVFLAGGKVDGGVGSSLIRLDYVNGEIIPTELSYDFRANSGGEISAIAFSPFDFNKMYVATTSRMVFLSTDGGETFERAETNTVGGHYLYGSCLMPSKIDPNVIYLSGSGYSGPAVFKSIDGGLSYQPMNEGMPSTLAFGVAPNEDESLIYAATEAGPYVYVVSEETWYPLTGQSTPNTRYWSVEFLPETNTARFGTYGRGIWDFEFEEFSVNSEDILADADISLYPNPTVDVVNIDLKEIGTAQVIIVDSQGKTMSSQQVKGTTTIDVVDWPSGTYYSNIQSEAGTLTKAFIKQ